MISSESESLPEQTGKQDNSSNSLHAATNAPAHFLDDCIDLKDDTSIVGPTTFLLAFRLASV